MPPDASGRIVPGSLLNEDPIEESEMVELVAGRTPRAPRPRPSSPDLTVQENELRYLPSNRTGKPVNGMKIPMPTSLDGGIKPINRLNRPANGPPVPNRKRKPCLEEDIEILAMTGGRSNKQRRGGPSSEVTQRARSPAFRPKYSSHADEYMSKGKQAYSDPQQAKPGRRSSQDSGMETVSDGGDLLAKDVDAVPVISVPTRKGAKWTSARASDPTPTNWTAVRNKRPAARMPKAEFPLLCFQRGSHSETCGCSPSECRGLVLQKSAENDYKVMHKSEIKILTFTQNKIESINAACSQSRKCHITLNKDSHRPESERMIIFTLRNEEVFGDFISEIRREGLPLKEDVTETYFTRQANYLRQWEEKRRDFEPPEPTLQAYHQNRKPLPRSGKTNIEVVIRKSPPRVRSPLGNRAALGSGSVWEVQASSGNSSSSEGDPHQENNVRPNKSEIVLKHRLSDLKDEDRISTRETRSTKIRKLESKWAIPLLFPFEGPKRQIVEYEDLDRLNSQEYLNDNLINFYLRYIEIQLQKRDPELAKEIYFLNTFFYERLVMKGETRKRSFDAVLKWTAKVDLFNMNYIVIPINESSHWYLAIICNLQNLERKMKDAAPASPEGSKTVDLESPSTLTDEKGDNLASPYFPDSPDTAARKLQESAQEGEEKDVAAVEGNLEQMSLDEDEWPKEELNEPADYDQGHDDIIEVENSTLIKKGKKKGKNKSKEKARGSRKAVPPDTPAIIILDSMGFGNSSRPTTIKNLREYLVAEALTKRNLAIQKDDIDATYAKAPNQNNYYDCGLYLLHYVERFFEQPKEFVTAFLAREDLRLDKELWRKEDIKGMRSKILSLILRLHGEYEQFEYEKKTRASAKVKGEVGEGVDGAQAQNGTGLVGGEVAEEGDREMEGTEVVPGSPGSAGSAGKAGICETVDIGARPNCDGDVAKAERHKEELLASAWKPGVDGNASKGYE